MSLLKSLFGRPRRSSLQLGRRLAVESLEARRLLAIINVATTGANTATCGAEATPCATINFGIGRAGDNVNDEVRVAAGNFAEAVDVNKTLTLSAVGNVVVNSMSSVADRTVTLDGTLAGAGNIVFNGPVLLRAATQLTAANVEFLNLVNAATAALPAPALTVSATTLARFGDTAGDVVGGTNPLGALIVSPTAAGEISIGANAITTHGAGVDLNVPVILAQPLLVIEKAGGDVIFGSTVRSDATARSLEVQTLQNGRTLFGDSVGVGSPLASLTTDAAGTTEMLGALVETVGNQTYGDQVSVSATLTKFASGNLKFEKTLTGVGVDRDIEIVTSLTGVTQFLNNVSGFRNLTASLESRTDIGGSLVDTTGTQLYPGPVQVNATTKLRGASVLFDSTLKSSATTNDLLIETSGEGLTKFAKAVGVGGPLRKLETNADGTTLIAGGVVLTMGDQVYRDPVRLVGNTTITAPHVDFDNTVDSDAAAVSLQVDTLNGGSTRFGKDVGAGVAPLTPNPLSSLTTNNDGKTILAGRVVTTGNQTYQDDVEIAGDATTRGATIRFEGNIDSFDGNNRKKLTVEAAADADIGDDPTLDKVGGAKPLSGLEISADGEIHLLVSEIKTQGNSVTFHDPLKLVANLTITESGPGDVTFESTVGSQTAAAPKSLSVVTETGDTIFRDEIGAPFPLSSLTTDSTGIPPGRVLLGTGAAGDTLGIQANGNSVTFNNPVVLLADVTITELGLGNVTFNSTVDSDATPRALEVLTPGAANTLFNDAIGNGSALRALITRSPGLTFLDGPVINILDTAIAAGNDSVLFEDNVTLTGNVAINVVGAGNVHFDGTILSQGGNHDLNVDTGIGNTLFDGTVGVGGALGNLTTDEDGDTIISGGQVVTNGNQLYNDDVIVAATTTFTGANVEFDATLNANANGFNVDVISGGLTRFGGNAGTAAAPAVVPLIDNLTTNAGGTTEVGGTLLRTAGAQTFGDPVAVTNSVAFQGANVRFQQTLNAAPDGALDVSVDSPGQTLFGGAVGGVGRLRHLTTDAPGNTDINGGAVTTTQTQTYNDPVVFVSATNQTTLDGGSVLFNSTLNAGAALQDLFINASGLTRFGDGIGVDDVGTLGQPIENLATDQFGTTRINTAEVRTRLDQTYNDPVELGRDAITRSTAGDVYFDQTVDSVAGGSFGLTAFRPFGTRPTIFNADVGGPANAVNDPGNLGHLIVFSNGPLSLVAAINTDEQIAINIFEGAAASVTDDVTLTADAVLRAQTNIDLNVGDDLAFQPGPSAVADGNLTVVADFGSNDLNLGATINALGTTGPIGAGGLVRFLSGPDNDFFNIQLARLRPGDNVNVNGAGNGAGTFTLVTDSATVNATCDPVVAPATAVNLPLGDSLNLFDTDQVIGHTYSLNSTQLSREDGLVVTFTEVQQFELNAGAGNDLLNAVMPGLPSVAQFNGGGSADQLDIAGSAGLDRITVDAITDLPPHRPFEIANIEKLRVRAGEGNDIVVNRVGIPSMLEGQGGNDLLAGSGATDVIFGGGGIDTLIGGDGNDFLFPDHDYDGTLNGILASADGDVSAGGNGEDSAAPIGALDSVCSIENLVDGGARKDVLTWLKARLVSDVQELMGDAILALDAADFVLDPPAVAVQMEAPVANPTFEHWLNNLYQALLGRGYDPSELAYYANAFAAGASREAIAQGFLNSPERRANIIDGWYQRYLGRSLDGGGRTYWLGVWAQQDAEAVEAAVLGSGEFFQRVGGTNQAWVEALYTQVLGRTGSSAEVQFWASRAATTPRAVIAKQFVTSDEYRLFAVAGWYQNYLARAPEAGGAQYWLNKLKSGVKAESIQSSILASLEFQQMVW